MCHLFCEKVTLTYSRTPLAMLHMLFMRVPEDVMVVTRESRLTQTIRRSDLIAFLEKRRHWCVGQHRNRTFADIEHEWETNMFSIAK